jgi:hypothetical protein
MKIYESEKTILIDFSKKFLRSQKPLPHENSEIISENFEALLKESNENES